MKEEDKKYMGRCFELAKGGRGRTGSNPLVGSVIVHNHQIIGEGFHKKIGEAHAEVNTIASVKNQNLLNESTLYVNLEPCSHYGKTPPCTELIIQKKIPRVVIGCLDPFPKVSGRGVSMLLKAGVDVKVGVLEKEARELNKTFITSQEKKRPYIILKWAQSTDAFIDRFRTNNDTASPVRLSSSETTRMVHKLRSETMAIMVGTNTALLDNPSLSTRHWIGNNPIRIVLDRHLRIPSYYHLLDGTVPTYIFTSRDVKNQNNVTYINLQNDLPVLSQILSFLYQQGIHSLLVEGGTILLSHFLSEGLWDEARVETAPLLLSNGIKAPSIDISSTPFLYSNEQIFEEKKGKRAIVTYKNVNPV